MTRKQKKELLRILIALALFVLGLFLDGWWALSVMAAAWLAAGSEVAVTAISGIFRGQLLDENFLMTIASIGAFALGDYKE